MTIHKIPSQIITGKLTPLKGVGAIILHHMAHSTADVKTVEGWHINKNYIAIGYNFWVGFDGKVFEGRGFNIGAHTLGYNDKSIGIGFQGDYEQAANMPDKQFNAGVDVIRYIMDKYGAKVKIGGHKDFNPTACPGKYFPLREMLSLKKRGENMIETAQQALKVLQDKDIINTPEHWEKAVEVVKHFDVLLIKVANALSATNNR